MSSSRPEGSRFSEYTPTDHQAPLWIAASITLTYAGLFLIVRLAVKWRLWSLDDVFLGVAHVLGIAQWATTFAALDDGVGKLVVGMERRDDFSQRHAAKLVFVSRILTLLTVGFAKCSVILFLRQIFSGTTNKAWSICTALLIGMGCWTFASVLAISVSCEASGALQQESGAHCPGDFTRWRVVTGLDVCLEVTLVLIPAYLFNSVQISRTRKLTVFGAFLPRIAVPAIFIAYLEAYIHFRQHGRPSIDAVTTLIWQQVLCGYSLVSATTPCLKGFLGRFRTEEITRLTDESLSHSRSYGQRSRSRTNPQSFALESLNHKGTKRISRQLDETAILDCRPAEVLNSANAYAEASGDNGDGSMKSFGSEQMIIHRKVEYEVTTS